MGRKIIATTLAFCLMMITSMTTFAAEPETSLPNEPEIIVNSMNSVDYNYVWLSNGRGAGTLYVYTSNSGTVGITVKLESDDSSAYAIITDSRDPNGNSRHSSFDVSASNSSGEQLSATSAPAGTWEFDYWAWSDSGTGSRLMVWIY